MLFVTLPFKNLRHRTMRTLLTGVGVTLGVASFVALIGLSRGVETAWKTGLSERGTHALAMRKGAVEILAATLDENLSEPLRATPGIEAVSGELIDLLQTGNGETVLLNGWPSDSFLWQTLLITKGRLDGGIVSGELVLGESLAQALGTDVGAELKLGNRQFKVRAVSKSRGTLNNNVMILSLRDMQNLTGKPDRVTVFNLRLTRVDDDPAVDRTLAGLRKGFPNLVFTQTRDIADNNKILQLFRTVAWGTSAIALLMCGLVVLNTLLMSVAERKHEIGILTALGWQPTRIMSMIGLEALMIAGAGGVAGTVLGALGLQWLVQLTDLRAYVEPRLDMQVLLETLVATTALGVIASMYPAWRAVRIEPTEALRYE